MQNMMTDTADVARAILAESMYRPSRGTGYPVVPPRCAVRCSGCGERVEARLEIAQPGRTHYILPVDGRDRCTSCVLTACEFCDGQPSGCSRCDFTGRAA